MADLSFIKEKNALKTAEISGKRAKIGHFTYRKQDSIAEIVSTMESFFVLYSQFRCYGEKVNKTKGGWILDVVLCASQIDESFKFSLNQQTLFSQFQDNRIRKDRQAPDSFPPSTHSSCLLR